MTKIDLFLELANPNENGESRWVYATEFVGKYENLKFGNGGGWCRGSSSLAKKFKVLFDKRITPGNSIDAIKLCGFNEQETFSQAIRADIKAFYQDKRCVMLGTKGFSENTKIEIDHKDGRKDDWRVSNADTQRIEDFQPLCKAANDVKRQICKVCKETNKRWDAKHIKGNPYSFYEGDEEYRGTCIGCYQYDPVAYRKSCVLKISQEVTRDILKKLYPED